MQQMQVVDNPVIDDRNWTNIENNLIKSHIGFQDDVISQLESLNEKLDGINFQLFDHKNLAKIKKAREAILTAIDYIDEATTELELSAK